MSILDELNEEQRKAAEKIDGPVLILAGAGSGKTRTVTYRIAHMIKEKGISPLNIMALTFTNKAAKEMKERAEALIGPDANDLVVSTFHSFSVRLLKTYSDRIGYGRNFNIYDVDDQKSIITKIKKELNIKNDEVSPVKIANRLSTLKEQGIGIEELESQVDTRIYSNRIFRDIYKKYDETLKANNAMDFSDLLLNAKRLLEDPYVLERVQNRYKYIVVDEYQDTNDIQYEIISKIAEKYKNICVVGDEDQSIYAFRGANINNILNFERDYKNAFVAKLEQNYRSTKTILDTANELIKNNKSSKGKKLWTNGEKGEKIKVFSAPTVYDEAEFIVNEIKAKTKDGKQYKDMTILYRTNSQSRVLEEKLLAAKVPYKIYGGMQFFQRKEIKDILAYMNLLNNPNDNHNFYRIINVPKRAIGDKTLEKIAQLANEKGISMLESTKYIDEIPGLRAAVKEAIKSFYKMMHGIYERLDELSVMEDGLFPSCNFDTSEDEIEEERRLCYVAVTRAKKELYLSHVSERMVWGQMNYMIRPSRFISEMKQGNLDYLSEKNDKLSKKTGTTILFNQEPKRKIENFNPFSLKSVRTSELKNKEKSKYKVGDVVNHIKFGKGKIKKVDEKSLLIDFMTGEKKIALILAEKLLKG